MGNEDGYMQQLSDRQREILEFLTVYLGRHGCAPSQREIAHSVGYRSTGGLHYQLSELKRLGYIEYQPNCPRTIKVLAADGAGPDPAEIVMAPVVGRIAAGTPILAQENIEHVVPLPPLIVGHGDLILLRVQGDSMLDAAILDGDWVVVRQQDTAAYGQTVAALIVNEATGESEATVKVLGHRAGRVWLDACNQKHGPIPGDKASILGVVVAVLRSLKSTASP
ncbi:MAG TPA: transcriptional repressor LexA [Streptosporangiaceae bacterium]|nr:transcriptional repressor LexA [Streptosporangiaceae bacterium]